MDDVTLYHGSHGGIQGQIQPKSRPFCDFGKGFYMGTNPLQVKTLVSGNPNPFFYKLKVRLSEIPNKRILQLKDLEWAYFVIYNRGKLEAIKGTPFYKKCASLAKGKDFIIGPIADDSMARVIKEFVSNRITDITLLKCLQAIDYGVQYVAKTPRACSVIEKVLEKEIDEEEIISLLLKTAELRKKGTSLAEEMIWKYQGQGKFFSQILNKYKMILQNDIKNQSNRRS